MHGQYCEERQQQWHMRPGPSQRPDSSSVKCFSKDGRKVGVGDCALFQAGNAPPFIGIIRKLTSEEEGNLKLGVNWLYRPVDIKLGKGVSLEAAPNEVFYSFHKDEISAASLLHPCKVAFLQKGVELPSEVLSYVCRRVYDIPKKCLYWLTDQDYTKEHQDEVDQLLDRTKREMQAAVQSGGASQRSSSQQQKVDSVLNAALPGQGKGKKRERTDQSVEPCKRERSMKVEDGDMVVSKQECSMKLEDITSIAEKDGGLSNMPEVDQLVQVMREERSDTSRNPVDVASRRSLLARIVAATEREDCLTCFVQLGGLPVLDDWLQEAHKGRIGDGGSPKEGDKALDELLLTLLQALDKLPVDLDALKTCIVGKSVNNLKSHRNSEIQKRARKLVDTWKKRVKVEMKSSGESKSGSNPGTPWSCKQPSNESHWTKGRSTSEGASIKGTAVVKPANGSCLGDMKCSSVSVGGCKDSPVMPSNTNPKDPVKSHGSGTSEGQVKEEKSSSSSQSQNNSQSWCSGSVKGARSWKEEMKTSSAVSTGTKTTLRSHTHSGKCRQTASLTGAQQDLASGKHAHCNRRPGHEKVTRSTSMEKGVAESLRAENSNNQRLIVRLPNPGRSPARTASGGSLADGGTSASRGSSPGSSERHDSVDGKSKQVSSVPAVHSPDTSGDTRSGNGNYVGVKSEAADCIGVKERPCVTSADDTDFQSSDAEHKPKESEPCSNHIKNYSGNCMPDVMQVGVVKKGSSASVAALGSIEPSKEAHDPETSDGGMDLLASIAACEGSASERSFSEQTPAKDANREPGKQMRHLNEPPLRNQGDGFLVEDDEKRKKDGLPKLSAKGSMERAGMERVDPESFAAQQAKGLTQVLKEQPGVSTSGKDVEERFADVATESTLISTDSSVVKDMNVAAARGTEALFGSQDGCGRVKRETADEEKGVVSGLSTDICNASCLTGECLTGTVSGLESAGFMEEGIEDLKKAATNSPSSLVRMTSVGDVGNPTDSISGYYEEDALEVACQVAKEVEQEVERYGNKPEAQDVNSVSVCKVEANHESPVRENANCKPPCKGDAKSKGHDQDRCCRDAVVYSDDSQETVTEKREGMEALRPPGGEGEEVDQLSCCLHSPESSRPVLESGLGSIVDDNSKKDVKEVTILEKSGQSSPPAVLDESVDATVSNVHASDGPTLDQEATLTIASNDGTSGNSDASGRPAFDLNEGFVADETLHDDANPITVPFCNPAGFVHDSPLATLAVASSLTAPIAVVAAAKGAFIPPSNLSRCKAELGWKGSAATSAFRPAEPRRTSETVQSPSDTTGTGAAGDFAGQIGKRPRILDIDLNVADERVMEDVDMVSKIHSQIPVLGMAVQSTVPGLEYHKGSLNESSSSGFYVNNHPVPFRPELDLNKVGETEESMSALGSDIRDAEQSGRCSNNPSLSTTPVMRDFDLNDGPCLEECAGEEPHILQYSNVKKLENLALPGPVGTRSNPELVNVASWYPGANSLQTVVMPGFSMGRAESSYPGIAAPTGKNIMNVGHSVTPFNGDLYRAGAVMSSSATASYASTMPVDFPYSGFQFGSGFSFTSASYNMSSTPFVTSANSTPFQTAPSQLVSAGAVISPYGRPYLVGLTEFPTAETGASWSRPNLDLNAGPDVADADTREEGFSARQMSALGQLSFQQAGSSGGPSKRKEPESGFDPFRSGFKQMTWQ